MSRQQALQLDAADPLAQFRDRFHLLANKIYMDGNSLGLMPRDAETAILRAIDQWKTLGIDGWMFSDPGWFTLGERLGELMAPLVGAEADEVVATGTTTVNQHNLVSTFYVPAGVRRKIVATELDFPSDIYALQSQILLKGGNPDRDLIEVPSRDSRTIDEADIIDAMTDEVAMVLLPSVLYRSGQLFDIEQITTAAHERGIVAGFDCAHSAGAVPHRFDDWGVDFAFWCTYKYLNAGPGSVGGLYVNRKHFGVRPGLSGWWGYLKDKQFDMVHTWEGAPNAGAWQISTTPLFYGASLLGSLGIFAEAGIDALRDKSLRLTTYLMECIEAAGLLEPSYGFAIGTPREAARRGGHVAVEHSAAPAIAHALRQRGVVPDFREPNVIRISPVPLYTRYEDVWTTVQTMKEIIDTGAHTIQAQERELVA